MLKCVRLEISSRMQPGTSYYLHCYKPFQRVLYWFILVFFSQIACLSLLGVFLLEEYWNKRQVGFFFSPLFCDWLFSRVYGVEPVPQSQCAVALVVWSSRSVWLLATLHTDNSDSLWGNRTAHCHFTGKANLANSTSDGSKKKNQPLFNLETVLLKI